MTAPRRYAVPLTDALARQAVDREAVRARLHAERTRSRIGLQRQYLGLLSGHAGRVVDLPTGAVIVQVRAWTERRMLRRLERAYELVLARYAGDGRAES